jgi:hypothetical protein
MRNRLAVPHLLVLVSVLHPAASGHPVAAATRSAEKTMGEPRPDQALVYLIREKRFQGGGRTMFVYAGQQFLGSLDNDSYTFAYLEPGEHLLWLNWAKINKPVTVEAGKTYYFNLWATIDELDAATAEAFLRAVGAYVTPTAKETGTSAEHIAERYGKAQQVAAKKPKDEPERAGGEKSREAHIAKWPKADLAAYPMLCVEDFAMADPKAAERTKEYLIETAPRRLPELIVKGLGTQGFAEVRRGALCEGATGVVVLRGRFTQYKPGSETARLMVAGAGSAHLEMELELVEGSTGALLAALPVDRTWAWGGVVGASRGIEEMERNLACELVTYLRRARGDESAAAQP